MNQELKEKIVQFIKDNPEIKVILIDAEDNLHSSPQQALAAAINISAGNPQVTELVVTVFEEELKKEAEKIAQQLADEKAAEELKRQEAEEKKKAESLKKQQAKQAEREDKK
jgi:predicted nucleic acid-binding protein